MIVKLLCIVAQFVLIRVKIHRTQSGTWSVGYHGNSKCCSFKAYFGKKINSVR